MDPDAETITTAGGGGTTAPATTSESTTTVPPLPGSSRQEKFREMVRKKLLTGGSELLLNDRAITDGDVGILIEELKKHGEACGRGGTKVGENPDFSASEYYIPVTKIDLVGNFIGDQGCVLLAKFLKSSLSSVTDIDLFGNEVHADGCRALAGALCSVPAGMSSAQQKQGDDDLNRLTVLDVRSNPVGTEGKAYLIQAKKQRPSIAVYHDDMAPSNEGGVLGPCGNCVIS